MVVIFFKSTICWNLKLSDEFIHATMQYSLKSPTASKILQSDVFEFKYLDLPFSILFIDQLVSAFAYLNLSVPVDKLQVVLEHISLKFVQVEQHILTITCLALLD